MSKTADPVAPKIHYPLWFGGSASCFAACVTHPLDLRKSFVHASCHLCDRIG